MLRNSALVLLASLVMTGCAGSSTQLPGTTKLLDDLPRVSNSAKSPCWQQREIAAQNSYLTSIKDKREVVYKAPCDMTKSDRVASNAKS